jgi:hypothetical protein
MLYWPLRSPFRASNLDVKHNAFVRFASWSPSSFPLSGTRGFCACLLLLRLPAPTVQPAPFAVHTSILTIHCKLLNQSVLACYHSACLPSSSAELFPSYPGLFLSRHSPLPSYPFSFQSLFVPSSPSSSNGAPHIPFIVLPLPALSFATDGVHPSFPQSVLCEGPPFHLWPLLSSACALFCAMESTQHFPFQSLAHSFHRHGGVHTPSPEGRESRVRSGRPKGGKRQAATFLGCWNVVSIE